MAFKAVICVCKKSLSIIFPCVTRKSTTSVHKCTATWIPSRRWISNLLVCLPSGKLKIWKVINNTKKIFLDNWNLNHLFHLASLFALFFLLIYGPRKLASSPTGRRLFSKHGSQSRRFSQRKMPLSYSGNATNRRRVTIIRGRPHGHEIFKK